MEELAAADIPVERSVMPRDEAVAFFRAMGEEYKAEIIASIPQGEDLSLYRQGDFIDLCRGPHVPSTGKLKAFKLTKLAGAYWRGDSRNEMLQRIYGTSWTDPKALKAYLHRIEEAERRDHRRIGKKLRLFHIQEEAPGMVFWHPQGWAVYQAIEQYMRASTRAPRLPGNPHAAGGGLQPVAALRALRQVRREHVHAAESRSATSRSSR